MDLYLSKYLTGNICLIHKLVRNSDYDFRKQAIYHMAQNAEHIYGLVKIHLDVPYKTWLKEQLDPMADGDMVSLIGVRHLLNVSTTILLPNCPGIT